MALPQSSQILFFCNCSNIAELFTVLFLHRLEMRLGEPINEWPAGYGAAGGNSLGRN